MQYAPTLTDENGASNKHVFAPSGRFVGRMQYAPTRDDKKRKTNNEKAGYPVKFPGLGEGPFRGREEAGIPDALIFFSHPFPRIKTRKGWIPEKN